ncbi:MAG: SDR family oxidoreductase [Anaerolineae bacterium]|nr:SDR family oxidoreductase [Anaerolineae bacterium]
MENKVAIVTGGGTGIGAAVAVALAAAGARIVVCGRRAEPLAEVVAQIRTNGGTAVPVTADVSEVADVERVVATAVDRFATVDILINNAAIDGGAPIHRHSIEEWDRVLAINLRGPFLFARAVLPLMRQQQSGHIINISSESGVEHYAGNGAYGVSKHALNALAEYIQAENQELNIRVNTICPGMVLTPMAQDSPGLIHDKCLSPEDIADLVMWLLTRHPNLKIGLPVLIQTMANPWE